MPTFIRQLSHRCPSCGIAFICGAMLEDLMPYVRERGFYRTLNFPYDWYVDDYGHPASWKPQEAVTKENCDSGYLGDLIHEGLRCPKCGGDPFVSQPYADTCVILTAHEKAMCMSKLDKDAQDCQLWICCGCSDKKRKKRSKREKRKEQNLS